MAMEFYVEQADRPPQSAVANESIYAGELLHNDGDGADVLTYAATDEDSTGHTGLARYDTEAMAAETEEDVVEEVYDTGQRIQYQEQEADSRLRIRTPEDNGTDPAPSIDHQNVVGIVDAAGDTIASAGEFQGRIVQEGYTDNAGTPTTYSRANSNFKAVGVAYRPGQRAGQAEDRFDHPVRVVMYGDLKETQ